MARKLYSKNSIVNNGILESIWSINQSLNKIERQLCCSTGGGLSQVFYENSDTITFSGLGTETDPLIAEFIGVGGTQDLQSVTDEGNTTTNSIIVNAAVNGQIAAIGGTLANFVTSAGSAGIVVQSEATGKNIITLSGTNNFLDTGGGILSVSTGAGGTVYNIFDHGQVSGVDGTLPAHFVTLSQLESIPAPDLQTVTDVDNTTTNSIYAQNNSGSSYVEVVGQGQTGVVAARGRTGFPESMLIASEDDNEARLELNHVSGGFAKISRLDDLQFTDASDTTTNTIYADGRMSGSDATNPDEFITLNQLNDAIDTTIGDITEASSAQLVGTVYNQNSWVNLSDFTVNTLSATVVSNEIAIPNAAVTDFTKSLQLADYSCINHWKIEMVFRLTTAISGSTTGISIGTQSTTSNSYNSIAVYFSCSTTNTGRMEFFGQSNSNTATGNWVSLGSASSNLTFTQNDNIRLSIERINQTVIMRAENLSDPVASVEYIYTLPYDTNPIPPNTGHYTIFGQGGTFRVSELKVFNNEVKNPDIMFLGDSKTMGYGATNFYTTYPGLLGSKFKLTSVSAGFGDKTSDLLNRINEILLINPKQVVLSIGSNDARSGVSDPTFQANYASITTQLEAAGIDVIHLSPSFETVLDLSSQYTYVLFTYSDVIDIFYTLQETGNLYTDNIHWSVKGNRDVVNKINSSLLLKGYTTNNEFLPHDISNLTSISASGTSVTVTNGNVTPSSIVLAVIRTNDATAIIKNVVPSSGSFTINLGAAATGTISIGYTIIN